MKKKIVLALLLFGAQLTSNAQLLDWGIKGGLNYNSNGDIVDETGDIIADPEANAGFHFGFFTKTKGRVYVRPELVYTQTKSKYSYEGNSSKLTVKKIDAPVLLGLKIIGPLHAVIGPSFQYIIDTDLEDIKLDDVENNFTVGGTVGLTAQLGKLGIDARYERGFSSNEAEFLGIDDSGRVDTRPSQLILSASFRF
ncbi:MAG: outer membrane beta-barrel protein [Urechidicola sp.]|nr:outer membrane beta-barrel protein [Urechidicola sp.]